jgi:hypothetical protein
MAEAMNSRDAAYLDARNAFNEAIKGQVEAGGEIKVILAALLDTTTTALLHANPENRTTLAELLRGIADSLVAFHNQDPDR